MYQFSLDAYIYLFINSIMKSKKSNNLAERIYSLNEYHTYAVYKYFGTAVTYYLLMCCQF